MTSREGPTSHDRKRRRSDSSSSSPSSTDESTEKPPARLRVGERGREDVSHAAARETYGVDDSVQVQQTMMSEHENPTAALLPGMMHQRQSLAAALFGQAQLLRSGYPIDNRQALPHQLGNAETESTFMEQQQHAMAQRPMLDPAASRLNELMLLQAQQDGSTMMPGDAEVSSATNDPHDQGLRSVMRENAALASVGGTTDFSNVPFQHMMGTGQASRLRLPPFAMTGLPGMVGQANPDPHSAMSSQALGASLRNRFGPTGDSRIPVPQQSLPNPSSQALGASLRNQFGLMDDSCMPISQQAFPNPLHPLLQEELRRQALAQRSVLPPYASHDSFSYTGRLIPRGMAAGNLLRDGAGSTYASNIRHTRPNLSSGRVPTASENDDSRQSVRVGGQERTGNRSKLPAILYMPCDEDNLSKYQCVARKQIELFQADNIDVDSNAQGRNKPIVLGQVGIRCRHCAILPPRHRARASTYYPAKLAGLYQAAQNMASSHLCQHCEDIPPAVRAELLTLRARKSGAGGGKKYWSEGVRLLGVIEDEEQNILRLG